ncbi:MAG TPA: dethiobiotin synthase [Jatrophihabitantaceae bacterium]
MSVDPARSCNPRPPDAAESCTIDKNVLVVTGTGTDVGKTVVTAAIAALAPGSVAVVKPAQTGVAPGEPGDLAEVGRLAGVTSLHELARYPDPLSPHHAAARSGLPPLDAAAAVESIGKLAADHDLVLVEGAGGLLVPFDPAGTTLLDVARELAAPVVVVTLPGLGTLNHTALTLRILAGVEVAGVVIGRWPEQPGLAERCNVADLAASGLVGALPDGLAAVEDFEAAARAGLAPQLGGTFDAAAFAARWEAR